MTSARWRRSSSTRSPTAPTSPRWRPASRRCATAVRSTRVPRLHDLRRVELSAVPAERMTSPRSSTRSSGTSSACSATSRPTPTNFRRLVNELTLLLTYEATKDLDLEQIEVETPLERTPAPAHPAARRSRVCPILRAGVGMLDGVLSLIPGRARRLHRALPRRGDARAGRVLREAPDRHRRARRAPARPDARDRQLDRRRRRRC